MQINLPDREISVFSVLPRNEETQEYFSADIKPFIRLSEKHHYTGMLLFQSNRGNIEPWVFAQELLCNSTTLQPFIAVNPVYMHPFTVAKKILTLVGFYNRKVCLNFITGTAKSDLFSLDDAVTHDERYERLIEYITIIDILLKSKKPVSFNGRFFTITDLQLSAHIDENLLPEYFIAGSSAGAEKTLSLFNCTGLKMAKPLTDLKETTLLPPKNLGVHFGIITRENTAEAEKALKELYPENKMLEEVQQLSMENTDAQWKKEMMEQQEQQAGEDAAYCLIPFKNFHADCPFFIGSYQQIANVIKRYIYFGYTSFVIEIPGNEAEFEHIEKAFSTAQSDLLKSDYEKESKAFDFSF